MLEPMNKHSIWAIGEFTLKVGGIPTGLVVALLGAFRELFSSVEVEPNQGRRLHDSDFISESNHRTGRLDAGVDPYGWYDED